MIDTGALPVQIFEALHNTVSLHCGSAVLVGLAVVAALTNAHRQSPACLLGGPAGGTWAGKNRSDRLPAAVLALSHNVTDGVQRTVRSPLPVDPLVLDSLRELEDAARPGLLVKLIGLFLQDTPPRLAMLRTALLHGDASALDRAAHSLKGSCASLGATEMAALCEHLEATARTGNLADAAVVLEALNVEFADVAVQLTAILHQEHTT